MTPTDRAARVRRGIRAAAVYALCWFPLVAIYAGVLTVMTRGTLTAWHTLLLAFANALGPALMGLAVWLVSARLPWSDQQRDVFFAVHGVLSLVYAVGWVAWEFAITGPVANTRGFDYAILRYVLPWQAAIGFMIYGVVAGVSYAVRGVLRSRDLVVAAERAERLRTQAELSALRAHLNPHFFFNTLHSVTHLLHTDPARAEAAVEQLSDLFRYVLRLDRQSVESVTLEEEWDFTQRYLWLEQMRLGPRLTVHSSLDDDALACAVPPFTLQPLIENAVRHGLAPKREGGTINIVAVERAGTLEIEVSDDGVGVPASVSGEGLGIRAVSQRLTARYGAQARTEVESEPGRGFTIRISFPAEPSPAAAMAAR